MICADWHPDDDRLLSRYLDPGSGDGTLEHHLEWCRACQRRAAQLADALDRLHQAAQEEADAAFDTARLDAQRHSIQRRLGADTHGRILPFPAPLESPRHAGLTRVAAAVVLMALTGAGAMRLIDLSEQAQAHPQARSQSARRAEAPARAMTPARYIQTPPDEVFFDEIETALLAPRTAELRALDDLTPSARDLVARR